MPTLSLADALSPAGLTALGQVLMIDLMLAGDNVVVLGTLAAGLEPKDRKRVLGLGVGIALACLVLFAFFATQLLHVIGLLFAGGLLLLWVAWKLFRELRGQHAKPVDDPATPQIEGVAPTKSFAKAAIQVALADLSMSLDNVLAVAGAARDHPTVLFFGLALSVTLMAVAANIIARFIERHRWIAYIGLVVILYVAGHMIYDGYVDPEVGIGRLLG
ncbi:YjbE family putative metal transport protein [Sphingomonas sp.]|uniref:YjbE family putative metal transport protein n=1 Tax=Sphingomonas sp. TaxID=28214 RepID=UPI003CC59160